MADEFFYGVTLTGENSSVTWDVVSDEDYVRGQKLVIKQILLGAEAKENEFNVVEVHTVKDSVQIPIAVLKAGETRAVNPDVEFYESKVTFKLIKGSGPVYIHGQTIRDDVEPVDMEEEDEDDDVADLGDDDEEENPKKRAKIEQNADGKNAKNKKK
ncbi:nucleoplasmin-like protein [Scaptodrosophila lebanonensis]|uniref:Nucleoplasmin-like protein n=1 Tax=Drosophila lebanonensis TaxID=7225 RepID=A0A6J2T3I9_DROLE|nr:nucleoplasmin-like protein [Scaptodrosophila lebanonensis]